MTPNTASGARSVTLTGVKRTLTRDARLERLRRAYSEDPAFAHLRYQSRILPGGGSTHPRITFIVESPTKQDNALGRYLSGPERMVLDDSLKMMDLPLDQTYLTGLMKHSTPQGRCGKPEELLASMYYLNEELDLLKAQIVVVFGRHLNEWMFPDVNLVHQHGWIVEGKSRIYVPMFHPEAGLRNIQIRKAIFRDMGRLTGLV